MFEIKCLLCGSTDCEVEDVIDYDWEETPYIDGLMLVCCQCGGEKRL